LKKIEVKGWKEKMRDRQQWKLVVEVKAHPGCSAKWKEKDSTLTGVLAGANA
jgi:hypothetical protein